MAIVQEMITEKVEKICAIMSKVRLEETELPKTKQLLSLFTPEETQKWAEEGCHP